MKDFVLQYKLEGDWIPASIHKKHFSNMNPHKAVRECIKSIDNQWPNLRLSKCKKDITKLNEKIAFVDMNNGLFVCTYLDPLTKEVIAWELDHLVTHIAPHTDNEDIPELVRVVHSFLVQFKKKNDLTIQESYWFDLNKTYGNVYHSMTEAGFDVDEFIAIVSKKMGGIATVYKSFLSQIKFFDGVPAFHHREGSTNKIANMVEESLYEHKEIKSNVGIPQYCVEGNHEAIISPEVFGLVQQELERRKQSRGRHSGVHLFSGKKEYAIIGDYAHAILCKDFTIPLIVSDQSLLRIDDDEITRTYEKKLKKEQKKTEDVETLLRIQRNKTQEAEKKVADLETRLVSIANKTKCATPIKAQEAVQESSSDNTELSKKLSEEQLANAKLSAELHHIKKVNEHLSNKLTRPNKIDKIAGWVEQQFSGRLILADRAVRQLNKEANSSISIDVLCDALEYLAEEYWDYQLGNISWEETKNICAYKYERPFRIASCSACHSGTDAYQVNHDGQSVFLNMHLCYGNSGETMIRIYFFYDKKNKVVVVGSLPKHLPAATRRY